MSRSRRAEATALLARIKPQLTKLVDAPPDGPEWLHEIKFDGYRMHARLDRGAVQLLTRTGLDWTHRYHAIAMAIATLPARQAYLEEGIVRGTAGRHDFFQPESECIGHGQRRCAGLLPVRPPLDPQFQANDARNLPVIRFVPGEIPSIVDKAEDALLRANLGTYQRGTFIVQAEIVSVAVSQSRRIGAQRILEVGDHALAEAMTSAANWESFDRRSRQWVTIDAPAKVAATYMQRVGKWRLPILTGLINAPTLRDDGSILENPGYDSSTGLLLHAADSIFPKIPERPTRSEALQAVSILGDLVSTFPFVNGASRAVALSGILTACIRRSLPTAPMHAFTSPGSGVRQVFAGRLDDSDRSGT